MDQNEYLKSFSEFTSKSEEAKKFMQFTQSAFKGKTLDDKTKELIALACGIVRACEYCVGAHMKGAIKAGATEDEIIDTLNVAIAMSGGPGLAYSTVAYSIFKEIKG